MDPDLGEILTRWSVRLAVGCYVARVLCDVRYGRLSQWTAAARWFWTVGCALYLVHVVCAFAYFHGWSHTAAYRHTAEQTASVIGINWGGGLYVNYAFTLFWLSDTVRWWRCGVDVVDRSATYYWLLHTVFAFLMINATIVFGPSYWAWLAPVVLLVLIVAYSLRPGRAESLGKSDEAESSAGGRSSG